MDDFQYKKHIVNVKMSGLDGLDLEQDKPTNDYEEAYRRREQAEEMKRKLANKHFDPTYIESNIPDPPDTGSVSFDPNDMTFNTK